MDLLNLNHARALRWTDRNSYQRKHCKHIE